MGVDLKVADFMRGHQNFTIFEKPFMPYKDHINLGYNSTIPLVLHSFPCMIQHAVCRMEYILLHNFMVEEAHA